MSILDPKSDADLRALAKRSRTEALSSNDQYELDQAIKQSGSLAHELKKTSEGK